MFINNIILATFLSSLFMFEHVQMVIADNFTLDQFIGVWYDMGMISADYDDQHNVFTCCWFNVTKADNGDQSFNEYYGYKLNGDLMNMEGHGTIINSEVHLSFSGLGDESTHTVVSFNNGEELISHDKDDKYYGLVSRKSELSAKVKEEFEKLAKNVGMSAIYASHENCKYN